MLKFEKKESNTFNIKSGKNYKHFGLEEKSFGPKVGKIFPKRGKKILDLQLKKNYFDWKVSQ